MNISRRRMLASLASAGVFGAMRGFAVPAGAGVAGGVPNLRFGLISDIHCSTWTGKNGALSGHGCETFIEALKFYRDIGVDAVVITGDLTNHGLDEELLVVGRAWYEVFPDDKLPDGRRVEKIFVCGNHEWDGHKYGRAGLKRYPDPEELKKHTICDNIAELWEKAFREPYSGLFRKDVKGYAFIGAHWQCQNGPAAEFLMKEKASLPAGRPFFYCQHLHPRSTVFSPWCKAVDRGGVGKVLNGMPGAFAFSGHTHSSLTDERSIWQERFVSVNASSLRYVCPVAGYENSGPMRNTEFKQMPDIRKVYPCRQGMTVSVFDDRVVFERREFLTGGSLGPDWVVPLTGGGCPFSYAGRTKSSKAPKFPADAKVAVGDEYDGLNRGRKKRRQLKVTFPAALPTSAGGGRAFCYEVQVLQSQGDFSRLPILTKRVFGEGFDMPEERAAKEIALVLNAGELPHECALEFSATAINCFGVRSEPVFSDVTKLKGVVMKW